MSKSQAVTETPENLSDANDILSALSHEEQATKPSVVRIEEEVKPVLNDKKEHEKK